MFFISNAETDDEITHARRLFEEYAASLGFDLAFQNFAEEVASLPGDYTPPHGRLLLAKAEDEYAGCVALRQISPRICEMKRLYVRAQFRGKGIGRALATSVIDEAKSLGYTIMRLDTISSMSEAISLYRSLGFHAIPPYRFNPIEGAEYFELGLR
jgi:ribosomal protein S18 acetylase RimI-like enzyme